MKYRNTVETSKKVFLTHKTPNFILILAVIQARIGSTRLPGKVMLPLLDKPVIWHIYHRLKFAKLVDEICISTTTSPADDVIVEFAKKNNIKYYRGSEKNIISRHLGAAKRFNADVIVRINADCPLIDPEIVDQTISLYLQNPSADFVSNNKVRTFPLGLDVQVFPTKTLEKFIKISDDQYFYDYFISFYIYERPEKYTSIGLQLDKPNVLRWTLDYPEDYEFVKQVYSYLYKADEVFHMRDIMNLLENKPELMKINSMHNEKY